MLRDEKKFFKIEEQDVDEDVGLVLFEKGVVKHPDLLAFSVIELEYEIEYLIDCQVALEIMLERKTTSLIRIYDHKFFKTKVSKILDTVKRGPTFDQLDIR